MTLCHEVLLIWQKTFIGSQKSLWDKLAQTLGQSVPTLNLGQGIRLLFIPSTLILTHKEIQKIACFIEF
jgi:hypothetical protein